MKFSEIRQQMIDERPYASCSPSIIERLSMQEEFNRRRLAWERISTEVCVKGVSGLTLSNHKGLYAVVTADCNGGYRYTTFDTDGFIGHGTYSTPAKAIRAVFNIGLIHIENRSLLDILFRSHI